MCLHRLLMSAWLRTCSAQWRRWRRSTSDECPRWLFMEWLSRHQRFNRFPHTFVKWIQKLTFNLWQYWSAYILKMIFKNWKGDYLCVMCHFFWLIRDCSWLTRKWKGRKYNTTNRLRRMAHDGFVETCAPTSGCSSLTSSSLPSNRNYAAYRLLEQFWPIWRMRRGSTAMCCGSTCRRSWCLKGMVRFLHQGSPRAWTSTFLSPHPTHS